MALDANLDTRTNLVTGNAPANQQVSVFGSHYNLATGYSATACQSVTVNSSGQYGINLGIAFFAEDYANVAYFNADGYEIEVWDYAPGLEMPLDGSYLSGNFHSTYVGDVMIMVARNGHRVFSGTGFAYGGWWSQPLASGGNAFNLAAGDRVAVAALLPPGHDRNLTATVAPLTASIDLPNHKITGTSFPPGFPIGVQDWWWSGGWRYYGNTYSNVPVNRDGTYSFQFNENLAQGDYVRAVSLDRYGYQTWASGFSTTPALTLVSYPSRFKRGVPNYITYNVANGVHVTDIWVGWDMASHPDWNYYFSAWPAYNWRPGGPGNYVITLWPGGNPGTLYFRGFAWVDGRFLYTAPEMSAPLR